MIYNLQPGRGGMTCLIFNPVQAKALAKDGWSKQRIKNFVAEYARVPAYRHRAYHDHSMAYGRPGMTPRNPQDSMSIISDPKFIEVVVAGGAGGEAWGPDGRPRAARPLDAAALLELSGGAP